MTEMSALLKLGRRDDLWKMCCGFVDLSLTQFMSIQRRLLVEQMGFLNRCALGAKIMDGATPRTVEAFIEKVPFTKYSDYIPELSERLEDALPLPPVLWQHTSGRMGEYGCKWVPLTARYCSLLSRVLLGVAIFSGSQGRNIPWLKEHARMVYAVAPRPYTSGTLVHILNNEFRIRSMPPLERAEAMPFEDRVREGFRQALSEGLDGFCGLSLALVAVGEKFQQSARDIDTLYLLSHPMALWRLSRGLVKSRLAGRPLLPKDLWDVKGIQSGGIDSSVLGSRINEIWGRFPLNTYTCAEGGVIATQTWAYRDMTFVPYLNFLEFIPEREAEKSYAEPSHVPGTVLLDGVTAGESYEVVITNFHGGALVRYRMGDIIKITSAGDAQAGISLPQMVFERRADDLINLGFMRLTEKTIWQALENSRIPYVDWTAYKELGPKPCLNLYIEVKEGYPAREQAIAAAVYREIQKLDERVDSLSMYSTLEDILGSLPLRVFLLQRGAFGRYTATLRSEGVDLAHLKPSHINPPEKALSLLKPEIICKSPSP